jgi:hypothetical protein
MGRERKALLWLQERIAHDGDECLIWPFFRDPGTGRGRVGDGSRSPAWAHRVMCELAHGPAPTPKHQAAHSCGKGHEGCVNPGHLSWKTVSDNLLDRRQHGTAKSNPYGQCGVLKPEQIAEIRALKGKMPKREIAEKFGVGYGAIQYWHGGKEKRLVPTE